jgi:polyphosphate kinase
MEARMQQQALRILATQLADNQDAWELGADCEYRRLALEPSEMPIRSQWMFMEDSFGLHEQP